MARCPWGPCSHPRALTRGGLSLRPSSVAPEEGVGSQGKAMWVNGTVALSMPLFGLKNLQWPPSIQYSVRAR